MKKQLKALLTLCLLMVTVFALAITGSALESTKEYQIYYASELAEIMKLEGNLIAMDANDRGIPLLRIINDGVGSGTGEYAIFNFGNANAPEAEYKPEFPVKDYPIIVIGYKTNMNASGLSINVGMKVESKGSYQRVWGLRDNVVKADGKYNKVKYDLTTIKNYDGGESTFDQISADSGAKYVRIPVWAHSDNLPAAKEQYFDIEYIGFFKDHTAADAYGRKEDDKVTYVNVKYLVDGKLVREEKILKNGVISPMDAPSKFGMKFVGWKDASGKTIAKNTKVSSNLVLSAHYSPDPSVESAIVDNSLLHGYHSSNTNYKLFSSPNMVRIDGKVTDNGHTFVRFTGNQDGKTYSRDRLKIIVNTNSYFNIKTYPYVAISYRSNLGGTANARLEAGLKYKNVYSTFKEVSAPMSLDGKVNKAVYDLTGFSESEVGVGYDYVDWDSGVSFIEFYPLGNGSVKFTGNEYFDIEYVAFFKTKAEANAFIYTDGAFNTESERHDAPFIAGYDGYLFKPDNNMTRAEACTVITRLLVDEASIKGKYASNFTDLEKGAWYYDNIAYLESLGYLKRYSGKFEPNKPITRAEFVELVYAMGKVQADPGNKLTFNDVPVTHPRYEVIMAGASAGLVSGRPGGIFDPDGTIKRSEVVKVLCAALNRKVSVDSFKDFMVVGFADVDKSHWAYPYIIESASDHVSVFDKSGNEAWVSYTDTQKHIKEAPEQMLEELDRKFAERVASIRATESEYTLGKHSRIFYVSNDGNDRNDGLSPEKPIKTLQEVEARLKSARIRKGDIVLLKRGDEWHYQINIHRGITLSAYGEGPKPRILGSIEADNAAQWIATDAENVYRYYENIPMEKDVGNIVFDNGKAFGSRIMKAGTGNYTLSAGLDHVTSNGINYWKYIGQEFFGYKDMVKYGNDIPEADLMFYHDRVNGILYLYSRGGNPGDIFDSIEICQKGHTLFNYTGDLVIDNIFFGYTGSHGFSCGTLKNITIRNCEIAWIGGSIQGDGINDTVRFGNAVEMYGVGDGFYVYNNFIYQCFDCGPTIQVAAQLEEGRQINSKNIHFYGNALAEASPEVWLSTSPKNTETTYAKLINCKIYDNYVTMSGYGWKGYNHQKNEYTSFYGGGETGAEFIDCTIENNYFWNIRRFLMKSTKTSVKLGLGFAWKNNTILLNEGGEFAHMGSDLENADGFKVYSSYDEETISMMLSTGALGVNKFYYIPDDTSYEIDKNPDFAERYTVPNN